MTTYAEFSDDKDSLLVSRPTYAIEIMLGALAFFFGAYLVSPFYIPSYDPEQEATVQNSYLIRVGVALTLLILPSLITMLSLIFWKLRANKWRRRASFFQFAAWLFLAVSSLAGNGFYPVTWAFSAGLAGVAAICHFSTRAIIKRDEFGGT